MASTAELGMSLAKSVGNLPPESVIFGRSRTMQAVRERVKKVAGADVPVLILGESGTGKEIVANLLHRWSPWNGGPFVKVSCPAIPSTLLESELFGYEKGAFTGAYGTKPGRVEMAHRGTLFLDEIAELDPASQAKLLRLLQDGQFCRIGAQEDKRVEVRAVCATSRHLDKEMEAGSFRQDLFYRINVLNVQLPPLRERREDIPDLVNYFLECSSVAFNCSARPLSDQVMQLLQRYHWRGNIRQLENLIKRYVILGAEEAIVCDLVDGDSGYPDFAVPTHGPIPLRKITREAVQKMEKEMILKALQAARWNRKETARALKISYRALLYKIRQVRLPVTTEGRHSELTPAN